MPEASPVSGVAPGSSPDQVGPGASGGDVLEIHELTKRFGAVIANRNVTLTLRTGEIHAIIGPNGAGKSTLVKQVAGDMRHDSGTIRFRGRDIGDLDAAHRSRLGLARSFQVASLVSEFSVLQNVMLAVIGHEQTGFRFFRPAMTDSSLREPAMACVEQVGLDHRSDVPASQLSHGERKKLEIAIALALKPGALLLDEPMAGMGPEGTRDMTRFLHSLRETVPILLIEHDMHAVFTLADRVSVLVQGEILVTGDAASVRSNPEVVAAYLGKQDR